MGFAKIPLLAIETGFAEARSAKKLNPAVRHKTINDVLIPLINIAIHERQ